MDMPDVGAALSGGAVGALATVATVWIKARAAAARHPVRVDPDPLRVELQATYATKEDLRALEERVEKRIGTVADEVREGFREMRKDVKESDEKAEARASATHRRIDQVKDMCAERRCK